MSPLVERLSPLRPVVAIVGRPNVGKSTLLNRLTGSRHAITDDQPGVTRDRVYAVTEWNGRRFTLIDTGGWVPDSRDAMEVAVREQAEQAMAEADVVLFLCDGESGVTELDREVADVLRRRQRPCLLVVNKLDHPEQHRYEGEFYSLGLGDPQPVSAATGRRSGDLLDAVIGAFENLDIPDIPAADGAIRVAIAGRPNVGKSTLINRLAGHQVSIVSDQPGTTRDTTEIRVAWQGREFVLLDTAGLRRRSRIGDQVEYYSVLRASSTIEGADVVLVLLDGVEGLASQDARVMRQVIDSGCGLVAVVNKWDLAAPEAVEADEYRRNLRDKLPFLGDYPVIFISALTGRRVMKSLETVARTYDTCHLRVPTARLNRCVEELSRRLTPSRDGRDIRLLYATQHGVAPPTFVVFCSRPDLVADAYKRYLENSLRKEFGFEGTPLRVAWRRRRQSRKGRSAHTDRTGVES
ncbi:ribosome biogenesis GTPase Der [Candidatus Latescibacterota bacterium]